MIFCQLNFYENTLNYVFKGISSLNQLIQRVTSVLLYTLPLKDSLPFGIYLFYKFSFLKGLLFLTYPVAIIEKSMPFGGLLLFLILYTGVVKNPNVPYFIRYNACQALLLDIALIIFNYILRILPLVEFGFIVFVFTLSIFLFSIFQCFNGVEPEIPFFSKSVRMQI